MLRDFPTCVLSRIFFSPPCVCVCVHAVYFGPRTVGVRLSTTTTQSRLSPEDPNTKKAPLVPMSARAHAVCSWIVLVFLL